MTSSSYRTGFTLVEAVVIIGVTAVFMTALSGFIVQFYRSSQYTLQNAQAINMARQGVERAMYDLREATYSSDGAYPVQSAATSSVTFFVNINSDTKVERVTYTLINGILYRVVATPTGTPLSYTNPTIATTTIATSVVNSSTTPLFRYFDTTSAELGVPVNISNIAGVKVSLIIDINTHDAPIAFTLTNWARLRNLQP